MNPSFLLHCLKPFFSGKKILLAVTGSIASIQSLEISRLLVQCGAHVWVALTESAQHFVTSLSFEILTGQPVLTSLWNQKNPSPPFDLIHWADLVLIAPATVNTIARLAQELEHPHFLQQLLSFKGPVWLAPFLNQTDLEKQDLQQNLDSLRLHGFSVVMPPVENNSSQNKSMEKMAEPLQILQQISQSFRQPSLGKTMLITLGPTHSFLDQVRYLTNRSSGKMGMALVWAAYRLGYEVQVVSGPCQVTMPDKVPVQYVVNASQLKETTMEIWPQSHLFLSVAAVLDWDFANSYHGKIKKSLEPISPLLYPSPDTLQAVGKSKKAHQFVQGFATETENAKEHAKHKFASKHCDAIFVNPVSPLSTKIAKEQPIGFESDFNQGVWISMNQEIKFPLTHKSELAYQILTQIHKNWVL